MALFHSSCLSQLPRPNNMVSEVKIVVTRILMQKKKKGDVSEKPSLLLWYYFLVHELCMW